MTESPNNTIVTTVGPSITNSASEVWTITTGAKIAVNGIVDPVTENVVELAYVSQKVWQMNTTGNWYFKTRASDFWSAPTKVSPIIIAVLPSYVFQATFSPPYDSQINTTITPPPTPTITHAALQTRLDQVVALLSGIRADLASLSP